MRRFRLKDASRKRVSSFLETSVLSRAPAVTWLAVAQLHDTDMQFETEPTFGDPRARRDGHPQRQIKGESS